MGREQPEPTRQVEPTPHVDASEPTERAAEPQEQPAPAPAGATERSLPDGAVRVDRAAIIDNTGFDQPMVAATLFLPHGWSTAGGVEWGQQHMCTNGYVFRWSATSPDGKKTIAILPQESWEWNNYGGPAATPGCQLVQCLDVRRHLERVVQRERPNARVLGFKVREDLLKEFSHLNSVTPMPLGEMRTWVEAGEAAIAFSANGEEMRGSVAAVVIFNRMRTDAGTGVMDAFSGSTFPAYAASAPKAEFDAGFFEAVRRSIKVDPRWDARITNHNVAIANINMRAAQERSRITARHNEEMSKIREDAWKSYQESSDKRFREFGEVIREVETYADPDAPGGEVELSHHYEHAWRLDDGSYILTNDVSFEPFRTLGVDGSRLEAVR